MNSSVYPAISDGFLIKETANEVQTAPPVGKNDAGRYLAV
jgi:hypothetical protein